MAAEGLDLSDLGLTALPDWLRDFTRLTWLNLSGNRIGQLPAWLGELTALRQLDLARNRLIEVPESLSRLVDLRQLYLGGNRLISLPEPLGDLPALHTLVLDQNPLTSPPPEVVAAGTPSVLAFLRASGSASVPQWASKLMVVGEGRVGKTSLVKALSGRKHDPAEPTTHGLFVDGLSLAHPELAGTRMTLSVWDFGGQDIYHATHQFFLTDRSVFLLVWNSGEGTQRGRLQYWLDIITARAPQAPILLAATHAADRPVDIDLATLKAAYPAIVGSFPVDCAARTGFEQLHVALVGAAAGLPLMGAEWPRAWAAAAEALTGRDSEPYLSAARMFQVMDQAGVGDPAEQQTLATALAHRGQILFYPDDEELSDTVILDPQWLSTRISQVLDSPAVAAHNGLLTGTELGGIWPGMPRAQRLFLLALMEKFDICYRVRESTDDALAIVIAWLPQTPSDYGAEWRETRSGHREIRVEYQLPILPPGIPGWFLARSHRFGTPHRWRSGAVLRHPDGVHTGLLRTDPGRNRVELTVRGPMPGGFFALLDDGLNLTMDRYPGLRITRWVPCQGHGPCEKLFDYSKLIARLQREQTTAYCDEADEHVDIAALLYGIAPPVRAFATGDLRHLIASGFNALRQEIAGYNHDNQREYLRLRTLVQKAQQTHCPSVFTIVPDGRKRVGKTLHTLRLYCEEPDSWHPLPGADGCYEVAELSDWLRTVGPHLARTLQLLRATVPFVGPLLGLTAHELQEQLTDELDLTRQVLDTIGASSADPPLAPGRPDARPLSHADTDADFRTLKNLLLRLDPEQRWGGLSHVLTPEGMSLYLCSEHVAAYRPAVVP
ncbi:COR domain-containing protein [Catellatospora tritici]|uniref:COR domain-containing protein n=1 Tax=Catellatospora tritici TaxID=2851566 RepID=UPI0027E002AE|nr:COR domain-containing protein [Catellatospora tritici]